MANQKISALTALTGTTVEASADVLPIVDNSVGQTKKILVNELLIGLLASTGVSRVFVGSTTRDISVASGTQAVTGVGFTPKSVIFVHALQGGNSSSSSVGFDDGVTPRCIYNNNANSGSAWGSTTSAIYAVAASLTSYAGVISAFGADGFTITWTKTGVPTGTADIYYIAFR